ncbi:hypothetical protein WG66_015079, partial [Moniliophthora roreri]
QNPHLIQSAHISDLPKESRCRFRQIRPKSAAVVEPETCFISAQNSVILDATMR